MTHWEADKMLDVYIHDYLLKRELQATAKAFEAEAKVSTDPVAIDAPGGFLLEWWSVFWDIFIAMTNKKHSAAASSYIETQVTKTRDLQIQMQQQQLHPQQRPQGQQQTHQLQMQQLLLQRHAQQMQQHQRDRSSNIGVNPVGFLDTLQKQPTGAASAPTSNINQNALRDPLRRDSRSRLGENKGRSLDPKLIPHLNLDAARLQSHRQTLNGITFGNLQHVLNRNSSLPLLGQATKNKIYPVMDTISPVDSKEGSLLGAHGSNHGGNNLTLNGWPLTSFLENRISWAVQGVADRLGLDHLWPSVLQQPLPSYQLYLRQQLLQAQKNMVPTVDDLENRQISTLMNFTSANADVGMDSHLSLFGDAFPNSGSPMQASDADMLIKSNPLQKLYMQHQPSVQLSPNPDQNSNQLDKMICSDTMDAYLSNISSKINQVSKMQLRRKRKLSAGPANLSGTLNTSGPSAVSVPLAPSTHTAAEAIAMPSLSTSGGGSKTSATVKLDDPETLPSVVNRLAEIDRSVIGGPLEDSVESFLSPDAGDASEIRANVNEGFTFVEHQAIPVSTKLECCAFSSDGKLLATGGQDAKVALWCTESFTMKSMLVEHTLTITDVRFCPTASRLATSSADHTVRVWDVDNPNYSLRTFKGHSASVMSLDFHPCKDDLVYSADANGEIWCWSVSNGSCKKVFQGDVTYIRFQPRHGRFFAGASEDTVSIIDVETKALRLKLQGHKKRVICLCWDISGEYLATVSEDVARVWSFAPRGNGECIHELNSTRTDFRSCSFHPTYNFLLVIGCDQIFELWNMVENKMMTIPAHGGGISTLATSNISGLVASAGSDGFIKLWK